MTVVWENVSIVSAVGFFLVGTFCPHSQIQVKSVITDNIVYQDTYA